jgi:hypothetical protein
LAYAEKRVSESESKGRGEQEKRTLALVASLSKERAASTSVETRPGTTARSSLPNSVSCKEEIGQFRLFALSSYSQAYETVKGGLDLLVDGSVEERSISTQGRMRGKGKKAAYPPFCLP